MATSPDDRYMHPLTTKTLPNGRVVYTSALPIPVTVNPLTNFQFTTNERDRMDILAYNSYGTPLSWWIIAAGNSVVNGSTLIPIGTQLFIPQAP